MKKILTIVALSALFVGASFADTMAKKSSWVDGLSVNGSAGFESEYIFRGKNVAHNVAIWSVEGSYKLYKGTLYSGVTGFNGQTSTYTENDFYVGYKLPVYEKFSADFGGTYYWYTNSNPAIDRTFEVYAGLIYNGLYVNPAAYIYYDVALDAWTGELSGKYSWDLAKYGVANTALDVGAFVGVTTSEDTNSDQVTGGPDNGYTYYGVTADLVYSFTKAASASVGIRYVGNNDNAGAGLGREDNFGWGAKFSAGF